MLVPQTPHSEQAPEHIRIWHSLKLAISNSSGFQRWKGELSHADVDKVPLDQLVSRYLRETLATLAY